MRERISFEKEIDRLGFERDRLVGKIATTTIKSEVIYVRGGNPPVPVNYVWNYTHPRKSRSGTSLNLFDYDEMKHKRWDNWKGDLPPSTAPDKVNSIKSVLDLYDFIKSSSSGSVEELHFFTHGWSGGPILTNTSDFSSDATERDPNDIDPRIKDFQITTVLGGAEGVKFKQAFSPKSLVKLWGCTYEQSFRDKVREFYRVPSNERKEKIKKDYKKAIQEKTYQHFLQKAIGIPVYAAPLGWGTNPHLPVGIHESLALKVRPKYKGKWPPTKGDNWWRVSPYFRPDGGYIFYSKKLGAKLDVLDYVAYTDGIVK